MSFWIELLVSACLLVGSVFALVGAIGLYRLPDFFTRLHGPTKASTLGVGSIVLGSMIFFSAQGDGLSTHESLIVLFLFLTAPVSAHILAKAAMQQKLRYTERTQGKPWD
jgi:multicomponent K+:H+ antiporter subunit G